MKKINAILIGLLFLLIGVFIGYKYFQLNYQDKCLDLGGGQNPGNYPICVVEKEAGEISKYFCDENGNKFVSEDEARKHGLDDAQFGATFCQYFEN